MPPIRVSPAYDVIHRFFTESVMRPNNKTRTSTFLDPQRIFATHSVRTFSSQCSSSHHLNETLRCSSRPSTSGSDFGLLESRSLSLLDRSHFLKTRWKSTLFPSHRTKSVVDGRWRRQYSTDNKCPSPDCPHQHTDANPVQGVSEASSPSIEGVNSNTTSKSTTPIRYPTYLSSLPRHLRRLAAALPSQTGRPPSRDELLGLTTSFFERLRIRFKWATIRSYRHYRADDYSAFFSVGILGTLGWFFIGTTSCIAFVFFVINMVSSQEWLARKIGNYLTASTGVTVVFESAIVPKWGVAGGGSKIMFKNVYVSRGPPKAELGVLPALLDEDGNVKEETEEEIEHREAMSRWTHFHLSIDSVEVSLSLRRWLDGKGLVNDATVRGVRGVIDRSHVVYDPTAKQDRFAYRHKAQPGDFWLEKLQVEDFLVTVYQPEHFRPYTFSIFNADIRKLRKQWLFYDLLSAESITGQVDNCLFSLHKPQSIGRTSEEDLKDVEWARMSRFRVDGVPIDHMQSAHDTGVLSWVLSGRCDLVADIRFPRDDSDLDLSAIVADIVDEIGSHLPGSSERESERERGKRIPGQRPMSREALQAPEGWLGRDTEDLGTAMVVRSKPESDVEIDGMEMEEVERRQRTDIEMNDKRVLIDMDIRFKDLKASVPFFTSDLSYVNNALIRPIVAFINANRTLIPIRCHIDLGLSEFDGSWTTYDVGLLDRISEQTYAALAHHVQHANQQRIQAVSLWTLKLTADAVLSAFQKNLATF